MDVAEFNYDLPADLIAQYPSDTRDQSRLLVVDRERGTFSHTVFADIAEILKPSDVLVLNDTRVIPARLHGRKRPGGGKVEVFLLRRLAAAAWEVLIGGRVKPGTVIDLGERELTCTVREKGEAGKCVVEFDARPDLKETLYRLGNIPLPPYIHREKGALPADLNRYQTVYARNEGAVAAPTAGLHFSEALLEQIQARGVEPVHVTLHVGIGTFQPVKVERVEEHRIMPEWYELSEQAAQRLKNALDNKQRIVTVGTTSTRLVESVYAQHGEFVAGSGWADIFIYPGFRFQVAQALITNFHLPKSSLLMLIAAFGGKDLMRRAYREAIEQRYRFYSYGDAMVIL